MRADVRELAITKTQLEAALNGDLHLNHPDYIEVNKIVKASARTWRQAFQLLLAQPIAYWQTFTGSLLLTILSSSGLYSLALIWSWLAPEQINLEVVMRAIALLLAGIPCSFVLWQIRQRYSNCQYLHNKVIGVLLDEVDKHNQIVKNINTLDELAEAGNPVCERERDQELIAMGLTRQSLIRALETERILRHNPGFNPEQFQVDLFNDLTDLKGENIHDKAAEYGSHFQKVMQIAVSVQQEMKKLQASTLRNQS